MKLHLAMEQSDDLDMTPMIDVVFQLIIFFMVASSFVEQAKVYKLTIPKAESPVTVSTDDARKIAVTEQGIVAPAGAQKPEEKYESLIALIEDLKLYREEQEKKGKEAIVVIEGDKDAKYQRIIQVWNAAKNAGIRQISFAVEPGTADELTEKEKGKR